MSVVFRGALVHLRSLGLAEPGERDLLIALEKGRPALPAIDALAQAAGFSRELALKRAVAAYFVHCTGNLADDLADGDCDYYQEQPRVAPVMQFVAHNAIITAAIEAELAPKTLQEVARKLAVAASYGSVELRTTEWTEARYRQVGEAIAGVQWSAMTLLLWAGSALEKDAEWLGRAFGLTAFVLSDAQDPRFCSLPEQSQMALKAWVRGLIGDACGVPAVAHVAKIMGEQL